MPTVATICAIFQPFLVVRGRPSQLFGFAKTPDWPLLRHRLAPQGSAGSGPATGGCCCSRPFAHSGPSQRHKGSKATSNDAHDPSVAV